MLKVCLINGIGCLLICALVWVLLIPIVIENDTNHFNPLQVFLHGTFVKIIDFTKKKYVFNPDKKDDEIEKRLEDFTHGCESYFPMIFKSFMVGSIVYAISCLLMMIGSLSNKIRCLMIPYLINQLVLVIILVTMSVFFNLTILILGLHSFPTYLIVILSICCVLYIGWLILIFCASSHRGTCERNYFHSLTKSKST